jgi:FkbM family methyltransferase
MKRILKKAFNLVFPDKTKISIARKFQSQLPDELNDRSMFFYLTKLRDNGYKPDFVFDIGAYQGEWTSRTKKIFPGAAFLMIEAQRDKEKFMQKVVSENKDVRYEMVLVGKEHKADVVFYEMETGSSVYKENSEISGEVKHYEMKTLDDISGGYNITGEIFIKIDVQGAEKDVLEGASQLLQRTNFILLEASLLEFNKDAPLVGDIVSYLLQKGFVLYDVCDQRRNPGDEILFQLDLLFTKRNSPYRNHLNENRLKDLS